MCNKERHCELCGILEYKYVLFGRFDYCVRCFSQVDPLILQKCDPNQNLAKVYTYGQLFGHKSLIESSVVKGGKIHYTMRASKEKKDEVCTVCGDATCRYK